MTLRRRRAPFPIGLTAVGALVIGLAGCSIAATAPPPSSTPLPTPLPAEPGCPDAETTGSLCIVVLGDSIAYGTPLEGDERWPSLLERLLEARYPGRAVAVANWGVPGSRVDVLAAAATGQESLTTFDVAIVIEGVNDAGWTPLDTWRADYAGAIKAMETRGLKVVIGTPPPTLIDGQFTTQYESTTNVLREIAGTTRPILDIAARWRRDGAPKAMGYYSDLIHQGPAGQALMAEMARDVVVALEAK
jgi:lysophospholipase L1-like esterase